MTNPQRTTSAVNDLQDLISKNLSSAHAVSVVLGAALECSSPPTRKYVVGTINTLADLLNEAEKARYEILKKEHSDRKAQVSDEGSLVTSGM